MKMNMQFITLVLLIVAAVARTAAGAATLKHVHHKHTGRGDSPGDASSDIDPAGLDDASQLDDPEMPAGDSNLEAAAEVEGTGADAVDESAIEAPPPPPVKLHVRQPHKARQAPPVRQPHKAPTKHLRAKAVPKVAVAHAQPESALTKLQRDLKQERTLRLGAERLVKKLTKVLNHTTDALQKKDAEVDVELHTQSVQQAKLKTAEQELNKQTAVQHAASSRYEQMLDGVRKALSAEKTMHLAAEKHASELAAKLQSKRGLDPLVLKAELEKLKADHDKVTRKNKDSETDIEKLKDHVDEAEAARKAKTEELKLKVQEVDRLKKKEKDDLAALEKVEEQKAEALKLKLKSEEAKQVAELDARNKKTLDQMKVTKDDLNDLNSTDLQLKKMVSDEQQQTKHEKVRAETAEAKVAAEQKAVSKAKQEIAAQAAKLAKSNKRIEELKVQAAQLQKAQKRIEELAKANSELDQKGAERSSALETASHKLEETGKTLKVTRMKLKEAIAKIRQETKAEKKANSRVHELWQTMKQKDSQLEIDAGALTSVRQELSAMVEEKNVLAKELQVTESKLSKKARDKKELEAAQTQLSTFGAKLNAKDQELGALHKQLEEAGDREQDVNTMKAKLTEAAAVQKDLVDQLSAAKQHEKDQWVAAAAQAQELRAQLAAAAQREKDLSAKNTKEEQEIKKKKEELHKIWEEEAKMKANKLADALNAEQAVQQEDAETKVQDSTDEEFLLSGAAEKLEASLNQRNVTKAALLTGKSVLRSRTLGRELAAKDKQLKSALAQVHSMQAEESAKDMELEEARQALLHTASIALPTATDQEAAAAKVALDSVNGRLTAQGREFNATKVELAAAHSENAIVMEQLQVLKDDHSMMDKKVKEVATALIKKSFEKKEADEEFAAFKANISRTEQLRKDALQHEIEMKIAAKRTAAEREAAAKAIAAKQAVAERQKAEERAAAEKAKQAAEQARLLQQKQQAEAASVSGQSSSDDSDDDDEDGSGDNSGDDSGFAATVPWAKISAKVENIASPGKGYHVPEN